ncbi:MAG: hypothetical protein CBE07_001190 [Pelagibacteraceae bacterium TMED247]|nr:MAG: hypothetical protein CBE07_001190 [Pelagibacteraceae bacterium TMED247]|tara:strand:+ start:8625 stop:8870 length:246 start_codon:yes stop_codon:yes gene_type:complete
MFGIEEEINKDGKVAIHHLKVGDIVKHNWFCWKGKPRTGVYLGRNPKAGSNWPYCVLVQWHPVEYWGRASSCNSYDLNKEV